jgi:hypothetical protein
VTTGHTGDGTSGDTGETGTIGDTGGSGTTGDESTHTQETSGGDEQRQEKNLLLQAGLSREYQNWLLTHGFYSEALYYALQGKRGKEIENALMEDPDFGEAFREALKDPKYPLPPEDKRFVQQSNRWLSWDNLNLANLQNLGTPVETKILPILIFDSNDRQALPFGFATDDKAVEAVKRALSEADRMLFVEFDRDAKKLIVYELMNTGNNKSLTNFVNGLEKVNELPVDELRKRIVKTVKGEVKKIIDFECKGSGLTEEDIGAIVARVYKDVVKELLPPEKFPVASLSVIKDGFSFRIDPDPQKILDGTWLAEQAGRVLIQRKDINTIIPTRFGFKVQYGYQGNTYDIGLLGEGKVRLLGGNEIEAELSIGVLIRWGGKP